jgi:hypothetical protein
VTTLASKTPRDGTVSWTRWTLGVIGVIFLALGIWGFIDPTVFGAFALTTAHNLLFILTGLVFLATGFAPLTTVTVAWTTRVMGIAYAALGFVGFFAPTILAPALLLTFGENTFHMLAGLLIAILGFMLPTERGTAARARRPTL